MLKLKKKVIKTFKNNLTKKLGENVKIYCPKIEYYQYLKKKPKRFEKLALENYVFCYNKNFENTSFLNKLRFVKGLDYFLEGHFQNQDEIVKFIEYCKNSENKQGFLTQSFFKSATNNKAKFISGPFTNMMFEIIEKQKNKLKILVGNVVTTISDKKNYLYRPI